MIDYDKLISQNFKNLYNSFGKVTLKKGVRLFHWSNHKFDVIYDNSFFSLCNNDCDGQFCYEYEIVNDIDFLLTIVNDEIYSNKIYGKSIRDKEILTKLFNFYNLNGNYYCDDVSLKKSNDFRLLCEKMKELKYTGLMNYIDGHNFFEFVIYKPNDYIKFINKNTKMNIINNENYVHKILQNPNYVLFDFPIRINYNLTFTDYILKKDYDENIHVIIENQYSDESNEELEKYIEVQLYNHENMATYCTFGVFYYIYKQ